jgi:hypothetical protein
MKKIGSTCVNNKDCNNKNCVNNICTRRKRASNKTPILPPLQISPKQKRRSSLKHKIGMNCAHNSDCINKNCENNICTRRKRVSNKTQKAKATTKVKISPKKTIQQFMLSTKNQRKSNYLKNICSDSGLCIAFGIENNKIKSFFNNFILFDYATTPIQQIGNTSSNGFVKEIKFTHRDYIAYTILKSSSYSTSDHLWYEYMVGLQVNKWCTYLPCFVETYGLFKYKNNDKYTHAKNTNIITSKHFFQDALSLISSPMSNNPVYDYADICAQSKLYTILIQHIRGASFNTKVSAMNQIDTLSVLAQVYIPLAALTKVFVHNDLHAGNVMLYEPHPGKYIHFYYYNSPGSIPIEFKSPYVSKIIDYGRSYISDAENLIDNLCNYTECDPACGSEVGFTYADKKLSEDNYFISSITRNPSHDLRLFFSIYPAWVKYGVGITDQKYKKFGTRPSKNQTVGGLIANVTGAKSAFQQYFSDPNYIDYFNNNPKYSPAKKFGEMHVYLDLSTPIKFIKT